ncbi:MAG TPA: hypothetical protein DCR20_12925 [Planctomycetaceae bacterium]|nr:hypothetical protein [Planctomycetaceae bacterium]
MVDRQMLSRLRRAVPMVLAGTVFLSAFLLFQIQPLISRLLLPTFGGASAVWTTCMLFFQTLLFGGYLYSHLLVSRLSRRQQAGLHTILLLVACLLLRIAPPPVSAADIGDTPVLQILWLLLTTVGLPYFVLSTTGPLLLSWFAELSPGRSPHRLYALSNAGSLLALLSYPFVIEPLLPLSQQTRLWQFVFLVFSACCSGVLLTGLSSVVSEFDSGRAAKVQGLGAAAGITWSQRGVWFGLSCLATVLLLAETAQICQDVAVVPFLWVIPLALYLLSFILCFESDRWYVRRWWCQISALLLLILCYVQTLGAQLPLLAQLLVWFGSLAAVFMLCHGELARLRPAAQHLTLFYLTTAAGGACGGIVVGVLAPLLLPQYWEHDLAILSAALLAIGVWFGERGWLTIRRPPLPAAGVAILLIVSILTTTVASVSAWLKCTAVRRTFYGVLEVEYDSVEDATVLVHGRITHGVQFRRRPSVPTTYYGYETGVAKAIAVLRERALAEGRSLKAGLVGLGTGTLAAYGRPGDQFTFYEIDPGVITLAREQFRFLSDSAATIQVISGDARLQLEAQSPQQYQLLVLDAFSGDAVPTHLLTREAVELCRRHLAPGGILAIHISNLHLDLRRVTEGVAAATGMTSISLLKKAEADPATGQRLPSGSGSLWTLMSERPETLQHDLFESAQAPVPAAARVVWTDDYSNLLQLIRL